MKNSNIFLSLLLMGASTFCMSAQTSKSVRSAHHAAHQELLAGAKSRIDKSVINDMVKSVIESREQEASPSSMALAGLSDESSRLIDALLAEGRTHIGKRYVHGAKGPSAFDCSGFTSYVYRKFGYSISPSSRAQYEQGVAVDRKHLRKGDLVFFTSRSSGGAVGHVGIVVSANNETGDFKFIHASIKGVKISDFDGYYVPRYIGAKRIIEN